MELLIKTWCLNTGALQLKMFKLKKKSSSSKCLMPLHKYKEWVCMYVCIFNKVSFWSILPWSHRSAAHLWWISCSASSQRSSTGLRWWLEATKCYLHGFTSTYLLGGNLKSKNAITSVVNVTLKNTELDLHLVEYIFLSAVVVSIYSI